MEKIVCITSSFYFLFLFSSPNTQNTLYFCSTTSLLYLCITSQFSSSHLQNKMLHTTQSTHHISLPAAASLSDCNWTMLGFTWARIKTQPWSGCSGPCDCCVLTCLNKPHRGWNIPRFSSNRLNTFSHTIRKLSTSIRSDLAKGKEKEVRVFFLQNRKYVCAYNICTLQSPSGPCTMLYTELPWPSEDLFQLRVTEVER